MILIIITVTLSYSKNAYHSKHQKSSPQVSWNDKKNETKKHHNSKERFAHHYNVKAAYDFEKNKFKLTTNIIPLLAGHKASAMVFYRVDHGGVVDTLTTVPRKYFEYKKWKKIVVDFNSYDNTDIKSELQKSDVLMVDIVFGNMSKMKKHKFFKRVYTVLVKVRNWPDEVSSSSVVLSSSEMSSSVMSSMEESSSSLAPVSSSDPVVVSSSIELSSEVMSSSSVVLSSSEVLSSVMSSMEESSSSLEPVSSSDPVVVSSSIELSSEEVSSSSVVLSSSEVLSSVMSSMEESSSSLAPVSSSDPVVVSSSIELSSEAASSSSVVLSSSEVLSSVMSSMQESSSSIEIVSSSVLVVASSTTMSSSSLEELSSAVSLSSAVIVSSTHDEISSNSVSSDEEVPESSTGVSSSELNHSSTELSPSSDQTMVSSELESSEEQELSFVVDVGGVWISAARFQASKGRLVLDITRPFDQFNESLIQSDDGSIIGFVLVLGIMKNAEESWVDSYSPTALYLSSNQIVQHSTGSVVFTLTNAQSRQFAQCARKYNSRLFTELKVLVPEQTIISGTELNDAHELNVSISGAVTLPYLPPSPVPEIEIVANKGIAFFKAGKNWKQFKILTRKLEKLQEGGTLLFKSTNEQLASVEPGDYAPSELEYNPIQEGDVVYIQGGYTYFVSQTNDGQGMSTPIVLNSADYPSLDIKIEKNGMAFRLWFISEEIAESDNVVFEYTVYDLNTEEVIDQSSHFTGSFVDYYPLLPGDYYVHGSIVSLDNSDDFDSTQFIIDTVFVVEDLNVLSLDKNKWQMVTFGGGDFDWRLIDPLATVYRWEEEQGIWAVYDKYKSGDNFTIFEPGEAGWVYVDKDVSVKTEYATEPIDLYLAWEGEGWNQVGNPFSYDIPVSAYSEELEFFKWENNQYYKVNYLKPQEGYWVYVERPENITIDNKPYFQSDEYLNTRYAFKQSISTEDAWELDLVLSARSGTFQDKLNRIGVMNGALNGYDENDLYELPMAMGDAVYLSLQQDNRLLRTDMRAPIEEYATWTIVAGITTDKEEDGELLFEGFEELQRMGYSLYFGIGTDVRKVHTKKLSLSLNQGTSYTLIVSKDEIDVAEYAFKNSERVYNYPNPVKTTTTIVVQTESFSHSGNMQLDIYSISGKKIFTEVMPFASAIQWDATDNTGARVDGGMYHYEITIGRKVLTGQMMVTP